jgi:hypothetical protein
MKSPPLLKTPGDRSICAIGRRLLRSSGRLGAKLKNGPIDVGKFLL